MGTTLAFYAVALACTVAATWHLYSQGADFLGSVLFGSCVGVPVAVVALQIVYLGVMRVTRGAPFHVGDEVEVTAGPHKGRRGQVESIYDGRLCVGVALELETGTTLTETFDWDEIRKRRVKQTT